MSGEDMDAGFNPDEQNQEFQAHVEQTAGGEETAQGLGEAAVEQTTDASQGNLVNDIEKAHSMALGGDDARSRAVHFRGEARANIRGRIAEDVEERDARWAQIGKSEELAVYWDKEAEHAEEWAEILHDHPPTKEYEDAHTSVRFTGSGLAQVEGHQLPSYTRDATRVKNELAEIAGDSWDPTWARNSMPKELSRMISNPRLQDALNKPETTLGEIKDIVRDTHQRYLDTLVRYCDEYEQVLHDVQSGRAAEYTGKEQQ